VVISLGRLLHLARSVRQLPYLRANSRSTAPTEQRKALVAILRRHRLVNQAVPVDSAVPLTIDTLEKLGLYKGSADGPLVSVIMPVFNGGAFLETAIRGVLAQTYKNLELLIVDDASTDDSKQVAQKFAKKDARVRVISAPKNGGAYAARNLALAAATGDFVTVHDADDWSHPKKLEVQANDLIRHASHIGNISEAVRVVARASNSFEYFPLRGRQFIRPNVSSLMFRRAEVVKALGRWDEVRFGGDSEFHERMLAVFGPKSVVQLRTGPLSFTRVHESSLTASGASSTHQGIRGARRFYIQRFNQWHADIVAGKAHGFLGVRPFALPQQMTKKAVSHPAFESVIVADLTQPGLPARIKKAAKPVALVHKTPLTSRESVAEDLLKVVDFENVVILFEGETAKVRKEGGRGFYPIDTSFNV
jgi:hypothetical protein